MQHIDFWRTERDKWNDFECSVSGIASVRCRTILTMLCLNAGIAKIGEGPFQPVFLNIKIACSVSEDSSIVREPLLEWTLVSHALELVLLQILSLR